MLTVQVGAGWSQTSAMVQPEPIGTQPLPGVLLPFFPPVLQLLSQPPFFPSSGAR